MIKNDKIIGIIKMIHEISRELCCLLKEIEVSGCFVLGRYDAISNKEFAFNFRKH